MEKKYMENMEYVKKELELLYNIEKAHNLEELTKAIKEYEIYKDNINKK